MLTKKIKKTVLTTSIITLISVGVIPLFEPTITSAVTDDVIVTQEVTSGIAIDSPADLLMSQPLSLTASSAIGSVTWNVKTTNATGYTLDVHASGNPAMVSGANSFTDYSETVVGTPDAWSVTNAYEFGFSAHGNDVVTGTYGTAQNCGASNVTVINQLYRGFSGVTDIRIAAATAATAQVGTNTTVCFASEQDTVSAPSGTYTATVTATAVVQ